MKKLLPFLLLLLCISLRAQTKYIDVATLPIIGKATTETLTPYDRLPASLEGKIRKPLWDLGRNTAGLAVRFRSNTTTVRLRWENLNGFRMNHMTDTGVRGFDLYARLDNGEWRFAGSARPGSGKKNDLRVVSGMEPKEREYILYFPLYDGVVSAAIGVDSLATFLPAKVNDPICEKPVVFYGTSLLQGGCAARPGMAYTNIIERKLGRECINLGFSGNGQLDLDIARLMAKVDAGAYILDFVPNCKVEQMQDSMLTFYSIIRKSHPTTQMLFIEQPMYANATFDRKTYNDITRKNEVFDSIYNVIRKQDKNVLLLHSKGVLGDDDEATVDGTHFTDLGMMRYANTLLPIIRKMLKK